MCHQLYQISTFSLSHPSMKCLFLTPNSCISLAGDRIPVQFCLLWWTEEMFHLHPLSLLHHQRHGIHSSVCPAFHENSVGSAEGWIFTQGAEVQFLATAHTVYLHLWWGLCQASTEWPGGKGKSQLFFLSEHIFLKETDTIQHFLINI